MIKHKWSKLLAVLLVAGSITLMHWLTSSLGVDPLYGIFIVIGAALIQTLYEAYEDKYAKKPTYLIKFWHVYDSQQIYSGILVKGNLTVYDDLMTTYYQEYDWSTVREYINNGTWVIKSINNYETNREIESDLP